MRQQQHTASCQEAYLTARGLTPEKVIYFDIETTGFRASTSQLYMIGWAVKLSPEEAGTWMITQLLAETAAEEALILRQFLDVLKDYDTIVEFNGDRFDLPYLREKCASHQMGDPFEGLRTVDLYQEIRPCKSMLGMSRLNQKSVEQFLQISRKDPYNGGELIQVYREVRNRTAEDMEASLRALFLHNYEDVLGMLAMTPIVSYPLICACDEPVCCRMQDTDDDACCLEVSYSIPICVRICVPGRSKCRAALLPLRFLFSTGLSIISSRTIESIITCPKRILPCTSPWHASWILPTGGRQPHRTVM